MTGLILEIRSQEDAIEYARKDPDEALGVAIWTLIKLEENCTCRPAVCEAKLRKSRLKNIALQFSGGLVGGASAVWAMFLVFEKYVKAIKDLVK